MFFSLRLMRQDKISTSHHQNKIITLITLFHLDIKIITATAAASLLTPMKDLTFNVSDEICNSFTAHCLNT